LQNAKISCSGTKLIFWTEDIRSFPDDESSSASASVAAIFSLVMEVSFDADEDDLVVHSVVEVSLV